MPPIHDARRSAHEAALAAAERTLRQAHTFAALHATAKPLFQKTMRRPGSRPVLVRVVFPGVLQVHDPETGAVLARSEPGRPAVLEADFCPITGRDLAPRLS